MSLFGFLRPRQKVFQRNTKIVIFAMALDFLGWGFIDPLFSAFANSLLQSFFLVGLITTTKGLFGILALGPLSEIIATASPRTVAMISRFGTMTALSFYLLGGVFIMPALLFVGAMFHGIANSARDASTRDFLMEASNKDTASTILGANFSLRSSSWMIGAVLTGFLVLAAAKGMGTEPLIVFPLIFAAAMPLYAVSLLMLNKLPKPERTFSWSIFAPKHYLKNEWRLFHKFFELNTQMKFFMMLICFLQIIQISLLLFLPLLALQLNLDFSEIGILMAAMHCPLLFSALFSIFEDKKDRMLFIIGGLFFSSIPLLVLSQVNAPLLIGASAVLTSLCLAIIMPANLGSIAAGTPHAQAPQIASLQIVFMRLGTLVGALTIGFVSEKFGVNAAFLIIGSLSLVFALCAIIIRWYLSEQKVVQEHSFKIHPLHPHSLHLHHPS